MKVSRGATTQPPRGGIDPEECTREFMPLVRRLAKNMKRQLPAVVDLDDLQQSGLLGLLQAAQRYNGAREGFWYFARPRIRGAMIDGLRETDPASRRLRRRSRALQRCVSRLEQALARAPTNREIAAEMHLTLEQYHQLIQEQDAYVTVDLDCVENKNSPVQNLASQSDPWHWLLERYNSKRLQAAVSELPERERTILLLRLNSNLDLQHIATLLGVTESRICQVLKQASARVRCRLSDA